MAKWIKHVNFFPHTAIALFLWHFVLGVCVFFSLQAKFNSTAKQNRETFQQVEYSSIIAMNKLPENIT